MIGDLRAGEADPVPDDLTDEEHRAVVRQGDVIAWQLALDASPLTESTYVYGD
ncbi:hypothetical protein [Nocardiopsis sp. LOL_012]|uniref:hypothetical protein n=1 Tax=Nocardiopsis sp. LOL_012 TaxID=3345409 RepID=UPI003A851150